MTSNIPYEKLGSLNWDRGRLDVQALGAMLGPVEVTLGDGRRISPFAVAPWSDEGVEDWEATTPPLVKRLRGDWICLPFGRPGRPRTDLDPDWLKGLDANLESPDPMQHGACSNSSWHLESAEPHSLLASFTPDANFPIARIERRISVQDGEPAITCDARVIARTSCELPWGIHPVLRLPDEPGGFEIGFGGEEITALTYPGVFEEGVSRIAHGRACSGLDAVPMTDGSVRSFSSLPLPFDTEELLLVTGHKGAARLTNRAERYRVLIEWDPGVFPSVLLWISNRGRQYAPWSGRFLALGVEPVCSPFDLGYAHAINPSSPMRASGVATAARFLPGRDLETRYRFRFEGV
jgi:hypothetical protein